MQWYKSSNIYHDFLDRELTLAKKHFNQEFQLMMLKPFLWKFYGWNNELVDRYNSCGVEFDYHSGAPEITFSFCFLRCVLCTIPCLCILFLPWYCQINFVFEFGYSFRFLSLSFFICQYGYLKHLNVKVHIQINHTYSKCTLCQNILQNGIELV